MQKTEEICGHNCSCKNGEECHNEGVLNYFRIHGSEASYKEDYGKQGGEDVRECYRCKDKFLGTIDRFCCKVCLPIVKEKTENKPPFNLN